MLTEDQAVAQAGELKQLGQGERAQLDLIRRYWKGVQRLPAVIPSAAPREVRILARISRVNVIAIVVDSLAQSTFVEGYRTKDTAEDAEIWKIWQANKMDARQTGIHRAAFGYGASYAIVLPGEMGGKNTPVIRGVSPRHLTAVYGDDPDWPRFALERRAKDDWRLYDDQAVYTLAQNNRNTLFDLVQVQEHGAGVTPVIRYLDEDDLDADDDVTADAQAFMDTLRRPLRGQVAPLMPVQDQIDLTTFGLLVAQWYAAFRQRWAIGWVADDETQKMKAAASQLWTFDESPDEMKLGEFEQTDLDGYIKSREASLRHAATLSQTPVHELIGELVNLSAEALVAAEAGHDRKVDERKTLLGESHEQTLQLAGKLAGIAVPDDAQVIWRDTGARALSATVDALGKMVTMLGVPAQETWPMLPNVTSQDVERWKAAAQSGDAFRQLSELLTRQGKNGNTAPAPTPVA